MIYLKLTKCNKTQNSEHQQDNTRFSQKLRLSASKYECFNFDLN